MTREQFKEVMDVYLKRHYINQKEYDYILNIDTLEKLESILNEIDDYPLWVLDVAEVNGWKYYDGDEWRICSDEYGNLLYFEDDGFVKIKYVI